MKFLFILLISFYSAFAMPINDSLLKIHAVLMPKIYLMDSNFKEKLQNNSIEIAILYEPKNYKDALSLKEKIDARYQHKIQSYNITTTLVSYADINSINANIYYLFPTDKSAIKSVIEKAKEVKAITFSYAKKDLKEGVMLSLEVDTKVKPIINLGAAKISDITFRPVLLKISRIYTTSYNIIPKSSLSSEIKIYIACIPSLSSNIS